jgi:hypothetical protein
MQAIQWFVGASSGSGRRRFGCGGRWSATLLIGAARTGRRITSASVIGRRCGLG